MKGLTMKDKGNHSWVDEADKTEWANGWAVVSDPVKFASKFNMMVPGAYRYMTGDDIRRMENCGLIGRSGFFDRSDLETVRGILQYEQVCQQFNRQNHETGLDELCLPGAKINK